MMGTQHHRTTIGHTPDHHTTTNTPPRSPLTNTTIIILTPYWHLGFLFVPRGLGSAESGGRRRERGGLAEKA